ncbi:MAG: hypothetical protein IPP26_13620 [Flavobacteriales bacterium]|nr:hypothetical protein [Flavobacteriales bacterium]
MADLMARMKAGAFTKKSHDPSAYFKGIDNNSLVGLLALLQALPENHGKNIRIEELQRKALQIRSQAQNRSIDIPELRKYVQEHYPHNSLEDPPQNLFTENIMTPLGNRLLFAGITENQIFTLQQFLTILGNPNVELPNEFRETAMGAVLLLLTISDRVVQGLGYGRYTVSKPDDDNQIFFPSEDFIARHVGAFTFSEAELHALASSIATPPELLDHFLLSPAQADLDVSDHEDDPLLFQPILKDDKTYHLLSPTSIAFACVNKVIDLATRYGVKKEFLERYSETTWTYSTFMLDDLGYSRLQYDFPPHDLPIHEGLFQLDTDKFAYVLFQYDNGDQYNADHPFTPYYDEALNEKVQARRKEVFHALRGDSRLDPVRLFNLNLFLGIGRPTQHSFGPTTASWRVLGFNVPELQYLYRSGLCHSLTLWNYSNAYEASNIDTPFFLTNIAFYLTHDESFYFDDGHYDFMTLQVGFELDFRLEATQRFDAHSALYTINGKSRHVPLSRIIQPARLPLYSTETSPGLPFLVTLDSLNVRVWIRLMKNEHDETDGGQRETSFAKEVCTSIAYWLNEASLDINRIIGDDTPDSIIIAVDLSKQEDATAYMYETPSTDAVLRPITCALYGRVIELRLDKYFYHSLHRDDNRGEQNLVNAVIQGIVKILRPRSFESEGLEEQVRGIIRARVPLGRMKKLLVQLADEDIRVNSSNVKGVRKLHRYDVNRQIDGLAKKLTKKPYRPRKRLPPPEKQTLLHAVVDDFYNGLRSTLKRYESKDVLIKLLKFYESAIQVRKRQEFEATPLAECFAHHCDIEAVIAEKRRSNAQYSVTLRCLIEHVAAEASDGRDPFDYEGVDGTLAYMLNIVNWGSLSDDLRFEIADIEVSLLESGRVGTDKKFEITLAGFHQAKLIEDLEDLGQSFGSSFNPIRIDAAPPKRNTAFEDAFHDEFNIPYSDFLNSVDAAIYMAFQCDGSVFNGPVEAWKKEVASRGEVSEETVTAVINRFSLFERGAIDNVGAFGLQEVYPWRFGRELSLLRRPLVLLGKDRAEVAYGARSVYEFKLNLVHLIFEGRWPAKSESMKAFVANRRDLNGKAFNKTAFETIRAALPSAIVRPEVGIGPGKELEAPIDLGDIDVLVIDTSLRKVVAIECKDLVLARTPYEMHLELRKFIEGKNAFLTKVEKRYAWLQNNMGTLLDRYEVHDISKYSFEYLFLTSEAIPLPFVRNNLTHNRFLTLYQIRQDIDLLFN